MATSNNEQYFLRPELPREDIMGPVLGPFPDYIQLTYDEIRVGPGGDHIGYRGKDGLYHFQPAYERSGSEVSMPTNASNLHGCSSETWHQIGYSDLVIWAKLKAT